MQEAGKQSIAAERHANKLKQELAKTIQGGDR